MKHHTTSIHRAQSWVASIAAVAALLAPAACSSGDEDRAIASLATTPDEATTPTSVATTTPTTTTSSTTPTTAATTTTSSPTNAQAGPAADLLDGILAAHLAAGEFVGARIAVRDADGAISFATAGTTTVDPASAPIDLDTPWNVGSVTKTLLAVVVLQLAEEGRIDLDARIDGLMPDLADAARITPRQLLQHTSGLGEYNDEPAVLSDPRREWTPSELIAAAEAGGRFGEPGGAFHYSNTNFVVLGEIIERVTGTSWGDEIRTRIVDPLGLTGTSAMTDERPTGYQIVDGSFVDTSDHSPSIGGAAGAIQSTPSDLLTFVTALADGTLLSPASQAAMTVFVPGDDLSEFGIVQSYGLGLEQYVTGPLTIAGHLGTGEAQSAFVGYDAANHLSVAVMTNTAVAGPQAFMAVEALNALLDAE